MASISIEDALRTMDNDVLDYDEGIRNGGSSDLPPVGKAPRGIVPVPQRPDGAPQIAPPQSAAQPSMPNDRFVVLHSDVNGDISVTFHDESGVVSIVEENGAENILTYVPNSDPKQWAGKFLIIRGGLTIPKPVVTYRLDVL